MPVRTRFAPSPTGDLHLGNLRVAVFNHLFTRHHGGTFVLRVEDTDWARNREGSLDRILEDLRWAGLDWDEGPDRPGPYGPYLQSERGDLHRAAAQRLLAEGAVYPCFCVEEALEGGEDSTSEPPAPRTFVGGPAAPCPGGCRDLPANESALRLKGGEPAALRFRVPDAGFVQFEDEIRGPLSFPASDLGDFVILRSDGRSTYNFAVVVDDWAMGITHVIRGAGHLSNTPKHVLLFDALGAPRPLFAHLPMVLGTDRRKLSKREGSAGLRSLQDEGFHPDAVVNYLSLLGWSPGDDREILTRAELVRELTLDRVGASDTVFDIDKLRWVSEQHIQRMSLSELASAIQSFLPDWVPALSSDALESAVAAVRSRIQVFSDIGPALRFLFPETDRTEAAWGEIREAGPEALSVLRAVRDALRELDGWEAEKIGMAIRERGRQIGARGPALFHPLRLAVTAAEAGPELAGILAALGREESLRRLDPSLGV